MNPIDVFGIVIHPYRRADFLNIIDVNINNNIQTVQNGVNAASIVDLQHNKALTAAYNNSDFINIDGMGVVWALRFLGFKIPERVACPDLAHDVMQLAEAKGYKLFLFGAKEVNLISAIKNINSTFLKLQISGFRNGYYQVDDEYSIVQMINDSKAEILFLGMTSPQKELFVEKYRAKLNVKYILGVGGFFDILGGSINRAPTWMQNYGLEWFHRLIEEPKRMWRRYLIGNLKFVKLVLNEKLRLTFNRKY